MPQTPRERSARSYDDLPDSERRRVDEAVAFCADVVTSSWQETVADRAADCLKPSTFDRLFNRPDRGVCAILARLAKAVLDGKKKLHKLIGGLAGWAMRQAGKEGLARTAAKELAERIPIPVVDQKAAAVARGLQMLGIALCLSQGISLKRCPSFIDLALFETKEKIKSILTAALNDWTAPAGAVARNWASTWSAPDGVTPAAAQPSPANPRLHLPRTP